MERISWASYGNIPLWRSWRFGVASWILHISFRFAQGSTRAWGLPLGKVDWYDLEFKGARVSLLLLGKSFPTTHAHCVPWYLSTR